MAIVVLHPLAGSLYEVTDDSATANLPASAPSTRVAALREAADPAAKSDHRPQHDSVAVLMTRGAGLTPADLQAAADARAAVARLVGHVDGLGSPGPVKPAPDGQAVVFTADVTAPALNENNIDTSAVRAVRQAIADTTRGAPAGLQTHVTGQTAVTADGGSTSQNSLLLTALLVVAVVLLVVYRSVLLWVFPLVGALAGIVVAQAASHALANAGLTVSSLSTSILIVLAFGAASDYAVLLIHRYRAELGRHAAAEDAMAAALARTLPTLTASAATVVGAMLCLLAAESAALHGLGPVGAVAVVSALLAQTTFLPALLLVFGRLAFWPRLPRAGEDRPAGSRIWSRVGSGVARRPAPVAAGALVLLVAASVGLLGLSTDNNPLDNLKGQPESVVGAHLFADHFGRGAAAPLDLLTPSDRAQVAAATARSVPDVAAVAASSPIGGYAAYTVTLKVDPYGSEGSAAVRDLRQRLDRDAPGSLLGGGPAVQVDVTRAAHRDAALLIPLVLVVVLGVVTVLLRAVIAPVVLVATTALSFGASFGLADLLWRDGLGYPGIKAQLPLYIFVFLVALGVDYNIFLADRIREEARHADNRRATIRGLTQTGGVITVAGIILAATFLALAGAPAIDLTEVGTAIAIGVVLDTLLVRTVLVPASFLTIGGRTWWPARAGSITHSARQPGRTGVEEPELAHAGDGCTTGDAP